jgi:hypothetical protein
MDNAFGFQRSLLVVAGFWLLVSALPLAAQPPHPSDGWKFDIVYLKSGKAWQGQLLKKTDAGVEFLPVYRKPGEPTRRLPVTIFEWKEIDHIDPLDAQERRRLADRLNNLSPAGEKLRLENLVLKAVPWDGAGNGGLSYPSRYFLLNSDAGDSTVRRAADRLDQIYAAYANFLPPRRPAAPLTTIRLVRSQAEYQKLLHREGFAILNPAFYDLGKNEVLCGCDLQQLEAELKRVRTEHEKILTRLSNLEKALERQYHGKIPENRRQEIAKARTEIMNKNGRNEKVFQDATRRLFQTLYHEAFHAYLANFVYPPAEAAVPRWLNEGLAQIFETAIPEAGELRVGRPDSDRLARAKAALRKGDLVSLTDLLRSGPEQFLVGHANDQQVSDRYYLASWALAFYLTFDRKLLGTAELDEYVRALKRGANPLEAFRELVKEPLPRFEEAFHRYLRGLRSDGSTASLVKGKGPEQER